MPPEKNIWKHLTLGTAFRWTLAPEAPSRCRPGAEIKDGAGRIFLDPDTFENIGFCFFKFFSLSWEKVRALEVSDWLVS